LTEARRTSKVFGLYADEPPNYGVAFQLALN